MEKRAKCHNHGFEGGKMPKQKFQRLLSEIPEDLAVEVWASILLLTCADVDGPACPLVDQLQTELHRPTGVQKGSAIFRGDR